MIIHFLIFPVSLLDDIVVILFSITALLSLQDLAGPQTLEVASISVCVCVACWENRTKILGEISTPLSFRYPGKEHCTRVSGVTPQGSQE